MSYLALFRKDKWFLIKYLIGHSVLALLILIFQWWGIEKETFFRVELSRSYFLILPLALIIAVQIPVLIHNCVHRNLRPKWLNFIAGELAGFYVLLSMASFELNHVMHHAHADSDMDPHNPHKKNFFRFFLANNFGGTGVVLKKFLQFHGDTFTNRRLFDLIVVLHFINVPMRLLMWFFLLGPSLFLWCFVPSYLFHMFVFAHINYVTHETKTDGSVAVYNLDNNFYYRFVNFFGSGVYYHKNHHDNPNHYNPKLGAGQLWLFR